MARSTRPTVYTVAEHARVSVATVSRALAAPHRVSEPTRRRVLDAIDTLGYVPHGGARSLAADSHRAHGLVLPELVGPYYSDLLMGYEREAATGGDAVVIALAGGDLDHIAAKLLRLAGSVDGIVVMGASALPRHALAAIRDQVPVLGLTGGAAQGLEVIGTQSVESACELTRHLIEHGRTRLAFVGDPALGEDIEGRYRGFCEALGPQAPEPVRVGPSEADGVAVAERMLAGELDVDGLVCANDELALGVMVTLAARGCRVPEDVAVVGWDDVMAARFVRPSLTTVRQPVTELGATAARRLRELIAAARPEQVAAGPAPGRLTTSVIYRRSCGCASDASNEQEKR